MRSIVHIASLLGVMALSAGPVLADDFKELPAGPGRDVAVRVCAQCHSPELASNQRLELCTTIQYPSRCPLLSWGKYLAEYGHETRTTIQSVLSRWCIRWPS